MEGQRWSQSCQHSCSTVTVQDSCAFSQKQTYSYHIIQHCTPWNLFKGAENLSPRKNLHIYVSSSFIPNCPNLETTNILLQANELIKCGTSRQWNIIQH